MSARQNKKQRKGRGNANNRERTVTTLTEDPNTPYLIPTPSEEPAGVHMAASTFPSTAVKVPPGSQQYQTPNNFGGFNYSSGYSAAMQQTQQAPFFSSQAQQTFQPSQQQPPLPPGKNDLEILQNLKKLIIENQHPFFRAVPQPAALASLYKGPLTASQTQTQTQGRRSEQGAAESRNDHDDGIPTSASGFPLSAPDTGKRQTRTQGKDKRTGPPSNVSGGQQNNNNQGNRHNNAPGSNLISSPGITTHKIGKKSSGPTLAGPQTESRSSDIPPPSSASEEGTDGQRQGRYEYSRSHVQKPDSAPVRPPEGDTSYDSSPADDPMDGKGVYNGKDGISRQGSWNTRQPHFAENSAPSSDRSVHHTDARASPVDRGAGPQSDIRDVQPQAWGWQDRSRRPTYDRAAHESHSDDHESVADHHPYDAEPRSPVLKGQGVPLEPSDDTRGRLSDTARPPPLSAGRPTYVSDGPPSDARTLADFPPHPEVRALDHSTLSSRPDGEDIQSSRASSLRPVDPPGSHVPVSLQNAPGGDGYGPPDDISARPSLQERMNPLPNQSRTSSDVSAAPAELAAPPPPPHPRPQHHDRPKKGKFYKNQGGGAAAYNGPHDPPPRSGYGRPMTPLGPPPLSGGGPPHRPFNQRSPSVDARGVGKVPPSPTGSRVRDFRGPPRDASRDRPGGYRPDFDMDVPPARFGDGRPPYSRDYSPPPIERGGPGIYPPSPPAGGPGRDWGYGAYPPGRREWNVAEEDNYYNKARGWDGQPAGERERYDREYPPRSAGWDARPEREFVGRDSYPPGSLPPPDDRYSDRARPPGGYAPPYNRIRPRSPSPLRRPGPGPVDDPRPPMKRPREEYPPVEYYPPPGGHDNGSGRRGPPGEYPLPPPRSGSPGPPPSSGSSWPPQSAGGSGGPSGVGSDRDYRLSGYPPPSTVGYERPRSPGPPGRPPYSNRGGYGGRGGYNAPHPRP